MWYLWYQISDFFQPEILFHYVRNNRSKYFKMINGESKVNPKTVLKIPKYQNYEFVFTVKTTASFRYSILVLRLYFKTTQNELMKGLLDLNDIEFG